MYVHCTNRNCNWSQDDFWDEHYNPLKFLQNYEGHLLDFGGLDRPYFPNDAEAKAAGFTTGMVTARQVLVKACNRAVQKITRQTFLTPASAVGQNCPVCGAGLAVD